MIPLQFKLLLRALPLVLLVSVTALAADQPNDPSIALNGKLVGQFMKAAKRPIAHGRCFVYDKAMGPPSSDIFVRAPDQIATLDSEGRFSLDVPPGTYYLNVIDVPENAPFGPPAEGELIYYSMDAKGVIKPFVVSPGKTTDVGIISSAVPRKGRQKDVDMGLIKIEGLVADADGAPVEGAVVLAYLTPDTLGKAQYISEMTGKDGKFTIRVNVSGTYYLRIRGKYGGGAPDEGEIVNIDDPKALVIVTVEPGKNLAGVRLQSKRQSERGPLYKERMKGKGDQRGDD
jgi:carboxypeptidase family protein